MHTYTVKVHTYIQGKYTFILIVPFYIVFYVLGKFRTHFQVKQLFSNEIAQAVCEKKACLCLTNFYLLRENLFKRLFLRKI